MVGTLGCQISGGRHTIGIESLARQSAPFKNRFYDRISPQIRVGCTGYVTRRRRRSWGDVDRTRCESRLRVH